MTGSADDRPAMLVLEDGMTFRGAAFGAGGETFGEMVFNTGMTGYQETLTDPSYCGQIVAMTAPHIGNTGVNDEDPESGRIWVSGYVIREPARITSSWRAVRTLEEELRARGVTGIAISGTRALTRHLRERGAMRAAISTVLPDQGSLLERVLASPKIAGADLAREVSTPAAYTIDPPIRRPDPVHGGRGRPRHQGRDPAPPRPARLPGAGAARPPARPRRSWPPARTGCSSRTGPAIRRRLATPSRRCAPCSTPACRSSASAWAANCSAGRWG